jgi:hypothetical protein
MIRNTPILFYNFFHNGDLFNSKAFVNEIMEQIPVSFFYVHGKNPKILQDLNLTQLGLGQVFPVTDNDTKHKVIVAENATLVNTWIGAYFEPDGECTLRFSYNMYKSIYNDLNKIYGSNLSLDDNIVNYFPSVDFSKFDLKRIDDYITQNTNKKVLVCNGPALSNQCSYNGDMRDIIKTLADFYPNVSFICTHKYYCDVPNIIFTDDITAISDCDLNEISYISKFCDVIIGRSSGPFSFSCTKENINDGTKAFVCFGDRITDCFQYGIDTKSKFVFEKFTTTESLLETIKKEIDDQNHLHKGM